MKCCAIAIDERGRLAAALALCGGAASEQTPQLVCENWHLRLGQMADRSFTIDLDAKTCNGQACQVSANELSWQEQGGRYAYTINRSTGEGSFSSNSQEVAQYKNCRALAKER